MVEAQEKMYRDAMQEKNDKAARRVDVAAKSYFSDIWELQRKDAERANAEARKHEEELRLEEERRKQRMQEENLRTKVRGPTCAAVMMLVEELKGSGGLLRGVEGC